MHSNAPTLAAGTISADSIVVAAAQQVSSQLADETVILHVQDGIYYGLDRVGTTVWNLLQVPRALSDITDRLVDEYDVDAERCEHDLTALIQDLVDHGLVEVSSALVNS